MLGRLPGMDTSTHLRTAFRPASEQVWQAFLAALRELSLQRTAVDAESVRRLQERLPDARISVGDDGAN